MEQTGSRRAPDADERAGVVLCSHQRTFESNRGLEGGEMKNRASSRHKFGGELWRDEALLTIPAL